MSQSDIFWRETLLKNTIFYIKLNPGGEGGGNDDLTLVQIISARNLMFESKSTEDTQGHKT